MIHACKKNTYNIYFINSMKCGYLLIFDVSIRLTYYRPVYFRSRKKFGRLSTVVPLKEEHRSQF